MDAVLFGRLRRLGAIWLLGALALFAATWLCLSLQLGFATSAFVFLVVIILLSLFDSLWSSIGLSFAAAACLNYFFLQPAFIIHLGTKDVAPLFAFIVAATIITWLLGRIRALGAAQRAQERLLNQTQAAYLAEAQKLSATGSFGWNVERGLVSWSDESFRIFGEAPGPPPTIDWVLSRVHPDDVALARQTIDRARHERAPFDIELRLKSSDGAVKHVRVVARPMDGTPEQFAGALIDLTARKAARAPSADHTSGPLLGSG